jgi:hypothetical protein
MTSRGTCPSRPTPTSSASSQKMLHNHGRVTPIENSPLTTRSLLQLVAGSRLAVQTTLDEAAGAIYPRKGVGRRSRDLHKLPTSYTAEERAGRSTNVLEHCEHGPESGVSPSCVLSQSHFGLSTLGCTSRPRCPRFHTGPARPPHVEFFSPTAKPRQGSRSGFSVRQGI